MTVREIIRRGRARAADLILPNSRWRREEAVARLVRRLRRWDGVVVVGPWLLEVGYELLYWIPFVRCVLNRAQIDADRVVVVSRGGAETWYHGLASRYLDVLSTMTPAEFKIRSEDAFRNAAGAVERKHHSLTSLDRSILDSFGLNGAASGGLLHPSDMFRLVRPFLRDGAGLDLVTQNAEYSMMSAPALEPGLKNMLPERYVAAKFYFRPSFPDCPQNRDFVATYLAALSKEIPVALLSTGIAVDDHAEFHGCASPGQLIQLEGVLAPERNLSLQSQIVANSIGFVGTYGGFAYLAPLLGVPCVAFHSDEQAFGDQHLTVATRAFRTLRKGGAGRSNKRPGLFSVIAVEEAASVERLLPPLTATSLKAPAGNNSYNSNSFESPMTHDE